MIETWTIVNVEDFIPRCKDQIERRKNDKAIKNLSFLSSLYETMEIILNEFEEEEEEEQQQEEEETVFLSNVVEYCLFSDRCKYQIERRQTD